MPTAQTYPPHGYMFVSDYWNEAMSVNIRNLTISSPSFNHTGRMNRRFARQSGNTQPALNITGVPSGCRELAVICRDADAPLPDDFTHWLLYGVPTDAVHIAEGLADQTFRPGRNDFGEVGYAGPQPPQGHGPHHYYFWVYALSVSVEGTPGRAEFYGKYGSNVIEQNRLIGVYEN